MKLLAIETSTEACSVALWMDGEVRERHELAPRRHTDLVLPWADELLAAAGLSKSQLDAIAVGRGPGAFTGVRLAVALVQGMALALDLPVLPVSTLAALAMRAPPDPKARILAAIDARMGELYLGIFQRDADGLVAALGAEWMATPLLASLPDDEVGYLGVGSGFGAENGELARTLGDRLLHVGALELPRAGDIARLGAAALARGESIAADQLEPAYLRDKVALTLEEQAAARSLR
jgi:tRNA threonylcarbamoyladenosine biosynthesis protein TsaB